MNWVVFILTACVDQSRPKMTFYMDWDRDNIETNQQGWKVRTDRGTEVQITGGTLVNHTIQLLPCHAKYGLTIISSAFAGHGFPARSADSSAVVFSIQESLKELKFAEIHKQVFKKEAYCSAHNLIAKYRSDTKTKMDGLSFWIEGQWKNNSGDWIDLSLKTGLANGKSQTIQVNDSRNTDIVFIRNPSTLFNGIDFNEAKSSLIERQVLSNLMQDLIVEVRK